MKNHVLLGFVSIIFVFSASAKALDDADAQVLANAFPYLTSTERTQIGSDFLRALQADPSLAKEWHQLMVDMGVSPGSAAEMEAMKQRAILLEGKLRTAMAKIDPASGAMIDKIDRHMPELHPELVGK